MTWLKWMKSHLCQIQLLQLWPKFDASYGYHTAYLIELSSVFCLWDEAAGPLKGGILLFALIHQRWMLFAMWTLCLCLCIAMYWTVTNWSSLETCLQSFYRRANVPADQNTLLDPNINEETLAISYETYVWWSSSVYLIWNICQIEQSKLQKPMPRFIFCTQNMPVCLVFQNLKALAPQTGTLPSKLRRLL
jgi:hypothetical protein